MRLLHGRLVSLAGFLDYFAPQLTMFMAFMADQAKRKRGKEERQVGLRILFVGEAYIHFILSNIIFSISK